MQCCRASPMKGQSKTTAWVHVSLRQLATAQGIDRKGTVPEGPKTDNRDQAGRLRTEQGSLHPTSAYHPLMTQILNRALLVPLNKRRIQTTLEVFASGRSPSTGTSLCTSFHRRSHCGELSATNFRSQCVTTPHLHSMPYMHIFL